MSNVTQLVGERLIDAAETAHEQLGSLGDVAGGLAERASGLAGRASESLDRVVASVAEAAPLPVPRRRSGLSRALRAHPGWLLAGAFGIGVAVGLAARSRKAGELVASVRDEAVLPQAEPYTWPESVDLTGSDAHAESEAELEAARLASSA